MDTRYDLLKAAHVRNIKEYNEKFINRRLNPEKGHKFMPYIVVVIDEFGDLIMTAGKDVELPIARIAQLARAVGYTHDYRYAASYDEYHYRYDQSQLSGAYRFSRIGDGGFPYYP